MEAIKQVVRLVRPWRYSPVYRATHPRRFHLFGIGANKSGTHSVAKVFEEHYLASHEEDHGSLIHHYLDWQEGKIPQEQFDEILTRRDTYAWLEADASHTHELYLDRLLQLFPKARYVLTIRDCYSWLDSWINHSINYPRPEGCPWHRLHEWRYGRYHEGFPPEEQALADKPLYSISSYLKAWSEHSQRALELIPEDRLLIIRTHELSESLEPLARFVGVSADTLSQRASHSYKAPQKHHLLRQIPEAHLRALATQYAGELMQRFFNDQDYLAPFLKDA